MEHLFFDLAIMLFFSAFLGGIAMKLKWPLVLAYLVAGILIGPFGFNLITDFSFFDNISQLGIVLLLFLVGLELEVDNLFKIGKKWLLWSIITIILNFVVGIGLALIWGVVLVKAVFIGIILSFSSTVVVVKLLNEKRMMSSLHGQLALQILILQDILAIVILFILSILKSDFDNVGIEILLLLFKALAVVGVAYGCSKYLLRKLFDNYAHSVELLFIGGISWCFLWAEATELLGFSREIGAFIAGMSLAPIVYAHEILIKTKTLRDFFILIFFVSLGAKVDFGFLEEYWLLFLFLLFFIIFVRPFLSVLVMKYLGFRKRVAVYTSVILMPLSEFGIIIAMLGLDLGYLDNEFVSLIIFIMILSVIVSSFFSIKLEKFYLFIKKYLIVSFVENSNKFNNGNKLKNHIIIVGFSPLGKTVVDRVLALGYPAFVVDNNPMIIEQLKKQGIPCAYGDMDDLEVFEDLNLEEATIFISTLSNFADNLNILHYIRGNDLSLAVFMQVDSVAQATELYNNGADFLILRPYVGSMYVVNKIDELLNFQKGEEKSQTEEESVWHKLSGLFVEENARRDFILNTNNLKVKELKESIKASIKARIMEN